MTIHPGNHSEFAALSAAYIRRAEREPIPDMGEIAENFVIPLLVFYGWEKNVLFRQMHLMPVSDSYPLIPVIFLQSDRDYRIPVFICDEISFHQPLFEQACVMAACSMGAPFCLITSFRQLQYLPVHKTRVDGRTHDETIRIFHLYEYFRRFSELELLISPQRIARIPDIPSEAVFFLSEDLKRFRRSASRQIVSADPLISSTRLDLCIQQLINQAIFTVIGMRYGIEWNVKKAGIASQTLLDMIISAAISPAPRDPYDPEPTALPSKMYQDLILELTELLASQSSLYSVAWIRPADISEAFRLSLTDRMQNHGGIASATTREGGIRHPESLRFVHNFVQDSEYIAAIISRITEERENIRIFDPLCGTGQMALAICNLILQRDTKNPTDYTLPDEKKNEIIRVFTFLHTHLVCCDPDPTFASATQTILGLFVLYLKWNEAEATNWPSEAMHTNYGFCVRAGSVIFGDDVITEILSPFSSHRLLLRLHPVDLADIGMNDEEGFDCIISGGFPGFYEFHPDIDRYLQQRYISYQNGSDAGLFWIERSISLLKQGGHAFFITDNQWIRRASDRNFREWLLSAGIRTIFRDPDKQSSVHLPWIALHLIKGLLKRDIRIIRRKSDRYTDESCNDRTEQYTICVSSLDSKNGWDLEDPRISSLLADIRRGGIPLETYLLGELFTGRLSLSYQGPGTLLSLKDGTLWVEQVQDNRVRRDESEPFLLIPGRDPYLFGIISSSLIRWYMQAVREKNATSVSLWIQSVQQIPIPVIDSTDPLQQSRFNQITALVNRECFLKTSLAYARTFHDKNRILQSTVRVRQELNTSVMHLYPISKEGWDLILGWNECQ